MAGRRRTPAPTPGERLHQAVTDAFELAEHELALLHEAALTLDLCADIQQRLDVDGPFLDSPQGLRTHPGAIELRQQRIALARLLVLLRIPVDDVELDRLQRRAVRGVYQLGGSA